MTDSSKQMNQDRESLPERVELARRTPTRPENPSDDYLLNEPVVILVFLPHNQATPFVTWREGRNAATFWGHYHRTLRAALEDYETR